MISIQPFDAVASVEGKPRQVTVVGVATNGDSKEPQFVAIVTEDDEIWVKLVNIVRKLK
jgi:hypothetical protein